MKRIDWTALARNWLGAAVRLTRKKHPLIQVGPSEGMEELRNVPDHEVADAIRAIPAHYLITQLPQCSVGGPTYNVQAYQPQTGIGGGQTGAVTRSLSLTYQFGTGVGNANQIVCGVIAGAATATVHAAMDTWVQFNNLVNDASPTFTLIKHAVIELLNASQADLDGNLGTANPTLTLGNNGTQAWPGLGLTSTNIMVLSTGGFINVSKPAGWAVTAGDLLDIVSGAGFTFRSQWLLVGEA